MKNKNIKVLICSILLCVFLICLGISYAFFEYNDSTNNIIIQGGKIDMTLVDNTTGNINLTGFPESIVSALKKNNNYIDFNISGTNESTKDIYYVIKLNYGEEIDSKTRIDDEDLRFSLEDLDSNEYIFINEKFDNFNDFVIYVDKITNNGLNVSKSYRLRVWISDEVKIGNTANCKYTTSDWNNIYGSIKVTAYGDMEEKDSIEYSIPLYYEFSKNALLDTSIDYSLISNESGIFKVSSTSNDAFPIYFNRNSDQGYVIFNNKCWEVVRTTNTGGIKIMYWGVPNNNKCGVINSIGTTRFNGSEDNLVSPLSYAGYYYGKTYDVIIENYGNSFYNSYFGNDVTWDGSKYHLVNTYYQTSSNGNVATNNILNNKTHYTCFTDQDNCNTVYYVFDSVSIYIQLDNGKKIEDAVREMLIESDNTIPSKAAIMVNNWFENNMLSKIDYLEDTIFCNDRTISSLGFMSKDDSSGNVLSFRTRYKTSTLNLTCPKNDSFTVNDVKNGNGALTYPVGILSIDEYQMSGFQTLRNDEFWLMSPGSYDGAADLWLVSPSYYYAYAFNENDLYPVVSLKFGIKAQSGTGTLTDPYIIN